MNNDLEKLLWSLLNDRTTDAWGGLSPELRRRLVDRCSHLDSLPGGLAAEFFDHDGRAEEMSRAVLDSLTAQIAVLDREGVIIATNRAWDETRRNYIEQTGCALQSGRGTNYLAMCDALVRNGAEDARSAAIGLQTVLAGGLDKFHFQYTCEGPQENRWFLLTITPFRFRCGNAGAVVSHIDISAQIEAERALRVERDRFSRMAAVAPGAIFTQRIRSDGSTNFAYVSPRIVDIYGVSPRELVAQPELAMRNVHPEDLLRVQHELAQAYGAMSLWQSEFRVNHPDRGLIWVEGRATLVREYDDLIAMHGFLTDITDRKKAEEALRQSEEHLRLAMSAAPMWTWELTIDDQDSQWKDRLWTIMSNASSVAMQDSRLSHGSIHADDRQRVLDEFSQVIDTGRALRCEFRSLHADGSLRWSLAHGQVIPAPAANASKRLIGVVLDITARKQLEDQFHQSQKMEAIGRLAGGVAHDFNNLLTVISGYCHVLLQDVVDSDPRRQHILAIRDAGDRAARLTKQLLAFSRKTIASPRIVDLNMLLIDFEELLRRLVGEDIDVELDTLPAQLNLFVDPAQMEQVIANLSVNARDAMDSGGKLSIKTEMLTLSRDSHFGRSCLSPGNYAVLKVSDTGAGMSPAVQARIFEPFFTTKPVGKGTGLGLSVVHGIITQSGGEITVESQEGIGTTIRILLPLREGDLLPKSTTETVSSSLGTETILLVEDDDTVRRIARVALQSQGYRVLEAASAGEGLNLYDQHADEISLVVSDLIMPGMGGGRMAQVLRESRSSLRVLFISGYTDEIHHQSNTMTAVDAFLAKPFKPSTLTKKVRWMLDQIALQSDA